MPRLNVKEQAREQDERNQEEETELPQKRQAVMSSCGGHRRSINSGLIRKLTKVGIDY